MVRLVAIMAYGAHTLSFRSRWVTGCDTGLPDNPTGAVLRDMRACVCQRGSRDRPEATLREGEEAIRVRLRWDWRPIGCRLPFFRLHHIDGIRRHQGRVPSGRGLLGGGRYVMQGYYP